MLISCVIVVVVLVTIVLALLMVRTTSPLSSIFRMPASCIDHIRASWF